MAARRLKVFQAQFGFFDTIVATSSQTAALRAWGTHQNLFASGRAKVTTEEGAVRAAKAQPERVLKRPLGSKGPFELDPSGLPKAPRALKTTGRKRTKPAGAAQPAPDRSDLDKAEAALHALDRDRKAQEARLRQRQAEIDAEREAAQSAYVQARKTATAKVVAARKAFQDRGGRQ